ncbi:MAG: integrase [bacterium]|nr:integrase [bacterium]
MTVQRVYLNDKNVFQFPLAAEGRYIVRDDDLRGFFLIVGRRRKSFTVQSEHWSNGKRVCKTVLVGHAGDMTTREARTQAKLILAQIANGELQNSQSKGAAGTTTPASLPTHGVTLRQAWARYLTAHLERKERSPATIKGYADHVERVLSDWLDLPLQVLGENPVMVAERHDRMSKDNGPSAANGAMRTLRAIYNHARKSHRELPPENPTLAVDWNRERRRNTAMGVEDLQTWFAQARLMRHPIRREFHLFTLLSGSRPGALLQARVEHINWKDRILHIPRPKGGADRAFDIPLSRPMIRCLIRAMRASRILFPDQAQEWVFAGDSQDGHMVEHKEARTVLSKWGNDLRQTYRTIGQASGLSDVDMHLLMNHSLPGVNAGYITRAKLLRGHLRATQESLSKMMIDASGIEGAVWPFLAARKLGDPVRDPTPPDPRSKRAREERFWAFDAPRLLKAAMRKAELAAASQPPEPPTPTAAPQVSRSQTSGETEQQHQPRPAPPAPPHRDPVRSLLTM